MWQNILLGGVGGLVVAVVTPFIQQLINRINYHKAMKNVPPKRPIGFNTNNND
jgi:hypothetical protein